MKKIQAGFTLIEMIVVISVLGILAAIAIPRFIDVQTEARIAIINGLNGALRSATALAQAQYKADGSTTQTSISMDGQAVTVIAGTGRPVSTAAGIGTALQTLSGFAATYAAPVATFQPDSGGSATCQITYNETTGVTSTTTTGC